jgi:hypothetical protein
MTWAKGTLADFMGDNVIYRSLEPANPQLAGLRAVWQQLGMDHYYVPRKTTTTYTDALLRFLSDAQTSRGVLRLLQRVLFVGDTAMNDGTAARNIGAHLPMMGFIGAERLSEPPRMRVEDRLLLANRWAMIADFAAWVGGAGWPTDETTALLLDLDKTSLGARGRNDRVIDAARIAAVKRTMVEALGDAFDEQAFRAVYDLLNQPQHHYFTADNQDYLAYICLMVVGGVCAADELWQRLQQGALATIPDLVTLCQGREAQMPAGLRQAHDEVCRGIALEDPTPFKAFRRGEFLETVGRMNVLPADVSVADVLAQEIVITGEVAALATAMAAQGVLVFGISDKPDEASMPTAEQAERGLQPIHRTTMKIYSA